MKKNYQTQTETVLRGLESSGERPSMLLHCCCAPCASYVLEYLSSRFDISLLFYNPNIAPAAEYDRRFDNVRILLSKAKCAETVRLVECTSPAEDFSMIAAGREEIPEGGERCGLCIDQRLRYTAETAAKLGFAYFCTTLSVGPHKDAETINRLGYAISERYGVLWLPSDFKKRGGYQRSIELSRELGLYRQSYCGCGLGSSASHI